MTTIAAAMLAAMNNGVAGSTSASFGMSMAAFLLNVQIYVLGQQVPTLTAR